MQIPTSAGMLANSVLPVTATQGGLLPNTGETAGSSSFAPAEAVSNIHLSREIPAKRAQPDFSPENSGQANLTPHHPQQGTSIIDSNSGSNAADSSQIGQNIAQGELTQEEASKNEAQGSQDGNAQNDRAQREADQVQQRQEQQQQQDLEIIRQLSQRDSVVRAHEQAHSSVGGQYAGSAQYSYQRGPDGVSYAVGGEVSIDVGPINGDPQATLQKMEIVQRAALAPAEPSSQDRRVAALASQQASQARAEIVSESRVANSDAGSDTEKGTKSSGDNIDARFRSEPVRESSNSKVTASASAEIESSQVFSNRIAKINEILLAVSQNDVSSASGQLLNDVV